MSVVYLGNILGATGPSGPSGPLGCPSCFNFQTGEWGRASDLSIFASSERDGFHINCWRVGDLITVNGRNENNIPISEHLTIATVQESSKQITTSITINSYNVNYPLTICFGNNIGATGPSNGPSGPSGPTGATGPSGPGANCSGSSIDYLSLSHFSTEVGQDVIVTTNADRCWNVGQLLIVSYTESVSDYLIVKVLSYSGTSLSFRVIKRVGTLTANSWAINITGDLGSSGPVGATGPSGNTGATGPMGLPGLGSGGLLRGTNVSTNPEIDLNGGTVTLDVNSKDVYNLILNLSTQIQIINFQPGQIVYIKVKTNNPNAILTWINSVGNAYIYWDNDIVPEQTTTVGKCTIYKFAVLRYDPAAVGITTSVYATRYGCCSVPSNSVTNTATATTTHTPTATLTDAATDTPTATPTAYSGSGFNMTFTTDARVAQGLPPVNDMGTLDTCAPESIKISWTPHPQAYNHYHHIEVIAKLLDGSTSVVMDHTEIGSSQSIPGYTYITNTLSNVEYYTASLQIHPWNAGSNDLPHEELGRGKFFINCV